MNINTVSLSPTASIGVAMATAGQSASDLLRNADLAMYEAKAEGKGRVAIFTTQMRRRALSRIELQRRLEAAIQKGEISAFAQPILDLTTGKFASFEGLARWLSPEGQVASPAEFIPVAEQSDLIIEIGKTILSQTLAMLSDARRTVLGCADLRASVNLSARHFMDPGLGRFIQDQLDRHNIDASSLTLEMTESILLNDSETVSERFSQLHEIGVRIALDDFGTGYSSLSYLDKFPFDVLKIDRSFVTGLADNGVRRRLAETIVTVGRVIGIDVVAEGIETESDESFVRDMGCRYGQGFLYSRPVSKRDLLEFLGVQPLQVALE